MNTEKPSEITELDKLKAIDQLVISPDNPETCNRVKEFFKPPYNWLYHSTWQDAAKTILQTGSLKSGVGIELEDEDDAHSVSSLGRSSLGAGASIQISWNMDSTEIAIVKNGQTFGFICPLQQALELNPGTKLVPTRLSAPHELQLIDEKFEVGNEIRTQTVEWRNMVYKTLLGIKEHGQPFSRRPFTWALPSLPVSDLILVCDQTSWSQWIRQQLSTSATLPYAILLTPNFDQNATFAERTKNSDLLSNNITSQLERLGIPQGSLNYNQVVPHFDSTNPNRYQYTDPTSTPPNAFILDKGKIEVIPQ